MIWGGAWAATIALGSVFIRASGGYGAAITLSIVYAGAFLMSLGLAYLTERRRVTLESRRTMIPQTEGLRHAA